MRPEDEELLNQNGWCVDCESPLEISHETGAVATGIAVDIVLMYYSKKRRK